MKRTLTHRCVAWTLAAACVLAAGAAGAAPAHRAQRVDAEVDAGALLRLAEQGDARAAFLLGTRYASGRGGVRDDAQAVRWFRQAAEGGLAEAQYNLGIMYATGRGVAREPEQAVRWYREAAAQGIARAQYNLGTLYGLGEGVGRDEQEAARWLRQAAEQGMPEAQYNLAVLYEHGRGVPQDPDEAQDWYARAAAQDFARARERLAALRGGLEPDSGAPPVPADAPRAEPVSVAVATTAGGPTPAAAAPAPPPAAGGLREPQWLREQDPGAYTVQLMSRLDEQSVRDFAREHGLGGDAAYYVARKKGAVRFALVYGLYPNYADAKRAADALPATLRRLKPWVRNVAVIQKEMLP